MHAEIGNTSPISESAGKLIYQEMIKRGHAQIGKEGLNVPTYREDITLSNAAALYTTVLASVIREAVEPVMVGLELLQMNDDLMNGQGKGAIKLPKELRTVAAEVSEGGPITYTGIGYDYVTVTPTKKIAASKITWEMVKRGMVSLIVAEAKRAGKALARKVDYDIIQGLWAVVTVGNSNRVYTGGASTRVSYNNLIDARSLAEQQYFKPTHLVVHPDDYAALLKDTDFKNAIYRATVTLNAGSAENATTLFPRVEYFGPQNHIWQFNVRGCKRSWNICQRNRCRSC
jgi:HK97 family phage major capsid protein